MFTLVSPPPAIPSVLPSLHSRSPNPSPRAHLPPPNLLKQRCPTAGAGGVAVSMPPDPECGMYANGSGWWATSDKDTMDPLNPSLPRAVSHPSETQQQNGV